jgi:hypothetical protein
MAKPEFGTKEEFIRDLRIVLYSTIYDFNKIYIGNGRLALVDCKTNIVIEHFDTSLGYPLDTSIIDKFDISEMEVTRYMLWLYDYVTEGRLEKRLTEEWEILDEDIDGFFRGLESFPLIENNTLFDTAECFPIHSILHVLNVSKARRMLDFGSYVLGAIKEFSSIPNHMQLRDVALLAGIDEKTARNLANPKAKNRLVTQNWEGRTIIENSVAEEWLKNRGYITTVIHDSELERDLSQIGFWSMSSLADYVRGHREKLGLDITQVATRAEFSADDIEWLTQLENESCTFNMDRMMRLAKVIEIDAKSFVVAALQMIQVNELRNIELKLNNSL